MKSLNSKFKVAFVIVTYKTALSEIERLKKEIKEVYPQGIIYIEDNSKNNVGYATAVNRGIKKGIDDNCQLLIICNPDISLKKISKENLFSGVDHFDIWGLAMKQKGKKYFGGEIDQWRMSGGLITKKPNKKFVNSDFVSGSLMIIKKEVIEKIGFFNEEFFMYYEDVEFCHRAKKAGFKIGIDSGIIYEHFENGINPQKDHYLAKNRLLFLEKYGSLRQKLYERLKLSEKKILINFLSLNASSFLNRFFNFVLFFFLIRNLTPYNYGIYNLVWAYLGFFSPLADFGTTSYGLAYVKPKDKNKLESLLSFRLFSGIFVFLIMLMGTLFFRLEKNLVFYTLLASMAILSGVLSGSFLIVTSIKQKVYFSSIVSVAFNFLLTFLLLFQKNLNSLFLVIFFFYLVYLIVNFLLVNQEVKLKIEFKADQWLKIAKKSLPFVLIGFFAGLYFKGDIFILKILKSEKEVGIYSAGYNFLEALTMIAGAYSLSNLPVLAIIKNNKNKLKDKILKDLKIFLLLGVLISTSFYFFGPIILKIFLKSSYSSSIEVAKIVVLALPFIFVSNIFFNLIYILKKTYWVILLYVFQLVLNFGLNIILIPRYSYFASAYITVLCEIINVILGIFLIRFLLSHKLDH